MKVVSNIDRMRGNLIKTELETLPFLCKESFTIFDVPTNTTRGFHAHIEAQQLLVLIQGAVELKVISKTGTEIILLDSPGDLFLLQPLCWGEQKFLTGDTVLQVYSSMTYDPEDYITSLSELQEKWTSASG